MRKIGIPRLSSLLFTITSFLVFLALGSAVLGQSSRSVVNVGTIGATGEGSLYIALEKGYFKEVEIDLKTQRFDSGARMMAPLAAGELQVAVAGGINPALFNAVARGLPIVVAGAGGQNIVGHDTNFFMVRPDLKEEIKGVKDLKGKKIAVNARGSAMFYILGKTLETAGLTLKDVDLHVIPFPNMGAAFERKAIDVSLQTEPLATLEVARRLSVKWKGGSQFVKSLQISGLYFNSEWATKNKEVARNFMLAYLKGVRELDAASHRGPNRAEVVQFMIKHTSVKDPNLYDAMDWTYYDPNGRVLLDSIREQQEWWHAQGEVPMKVPMDRLVDLSYADYAVKVLGEWKTPHTH